MQALAIDRGGSRATAPPTTRPAAAAHAGMLLFGITMALLGAVLPALSERLRFDLAQVGGLFLVMNLCLLATSLALGPLMSRYGTRPPLVCGPVLVGTGLGLLAVAADLADLRWGVGLLGIGGGMVNGAGNTLVADLHDEPRAKAAALNRLGVFFGFGALLLPFAMGLLLEALGLAGILFAAAALCLAPAAISGLLAFPSPKPGGRVSVGATARLLRDPVVLLFAATLFFESANESVAGGYISTLLARDLGLDVRAVSWVVAGYWAALILARLALSRLALRVSASRLLVGSALCAAGALTVLVLTHHRAVAVAATTATAAALAGIFPTALGVVGARFASYTGTVFGILFTAALAGGVTLPWLTGQVAAAHGLRSALWLAVGSFLVVAALQSAAARWVRRPARGGPA